MSTGIKITGLDSVRSTLKQLAREGAKQDTEAVMGYTANYAIWVHEVQAKHKQGKQWKFLEAPARQFRGEIARVVREVYKKSGKMGKALLAGALRLQRESQKIVPIDTSALKASAFVAQKEMVGAKAAAAKSKSDAAGKSRKGRRK